MDISRHEIATQLIKATKIAALRRAVKSNSYWKPLFHGFREDSLQRPNFERAVPHFASNDALLTSLCQTYLDELGAPRKLTVRQRFAWSAEQNELTEDLRSLGRGLAQVELSEIPKS